MIGSVVVIIFIAVAIIIIIIDVSIILIFMVIFINVILSFLDFSSMSPILVFFFCSNP